MSTIDLSCGPRRSLALQPDQLDHQAARAYSQSSRFEFVIGIKQNGRNGRDGQAGQHGSAGSSGSSYGSYSTSTFSTGFGSHHAGSGSSGGSGGNGGPGSPGSNGEPGENGADAGLFDLRLVAGDAHRVEVVGSYTGVLDFR